MSRDLRAASSEAYLIPIANAIAGIYETYLSFDDAVDPVDGKSPLQLLRNELKELPYANLKIIGQLLDAQVSHIGGFQVQIEKGESFPLLRFYVSGLTDDLPGPADNSEKLKEYFLNQWRLRDVPASTQTVVATVVEPPKKLDEAAMAEPIRQSMLVATGGGTPDRALSSVVAEVIPAKEQETVVRQSVLPPIPVFHAPLVRQSVLKNPCVVVATSQENPEEAIKNSLYVQSALAAHHSVSVVVLSSEEVEKAARQFSVTKDAKGNPVVRYVTQQKLDDFTQERQFLLDNSVLAEEVRRFVFSKVKANFQMNATDMDIAIPIVFSEIFNVFSVVIPDADSESDYKLSLINSPPDQVKALLQQRLDEKLPLHQLILDLEARKASYEDRIRRGKKFHFGHLFHRTEARSANGKNDAISHILDAAICLKEGRSAAAEIQLFKDCDAVKEGRLKGLFERFNQIAARAEYRSLVSVVAPSM